jgi:hypothetical protein
VLFFPVYIEFHPRRSATFLSRMNLRHAAFASRMNLRDASIQPFRSVAAYGWRNPSSNLFRMNTCKSVSKQKTLTPSRMNTYEKHRGKGVLLLTRQAPAVGDSVSSASDRNGPRFLSDVPLRPRRHGARMALDVSLTPRRETSPLFPVSKISRADTGCGNVILPNPGQGSCHQAGRPGSRPG